MCLKGYRYWPDNLHHNHKCTYFEISFLGKQKHYSIWHCPLYSMTVTTGLQWPAKNILILPLLWYCVTITYTPLPVIWILCSPCTLVLAIVFNCLHHFQNHSWWRSNNLIQTCIFIMVALRNRADHYIFILSFVILSSFFLSSPNLSCRRLDVCHSSTHGVPLVRI